MEDKAVATPQFCPECGDALSAGTCPRCAEGASTRIVHRDILLLVIVSAVAVSVFLFTRAMAVKERQLDAEVAATWFTAGQTQMQAGNLEKTVEFFRKATANDRDNRQYSLALANALAAAGHNQEARQALLRLRESSPDDAEINLHLARLAATRGDVAEAIRYYHNALYGRWTGTDVDEQRRETRVELIQFLLEHGERSRALSELLILGAEVPDKDAAAQTETAQLFLQAGDAQNALEHFVRVINVQQNDPEALAGAGQAAFQLGDYLRARRYLEAAVAQQPKLQAAQQSLTTTKMVLSYDPLAPRLSRDERNQRLTAAFAQALRRLQSCLEEQSRDNTSARTETLEALTAEAETLRPQLQPRKLRNDPELLRGGMELIYRIEQATGSSCGEPAGLDRALLLIGRKHQGALQ